MAHTRTALITGGSQGIGYEICRRLVTTGESTYVLLHAPTLSEAHTAVDQIIRSGADPDLLNPVAADYRSLAEVTDLAGDIERHHQRLDLLINNAGAIARPGATVDGFDTTLQINYLAPYVLTRALGRPLNAAGARIVTVASALHRHGRLDPDAPADTGGASPTSTYLSAQVALVSFSHVLAQAVERCVTAVAVHPGYIDTGTLRGVYGVGGLPAADAAVHVLHAADPGSGAVNGGYYEGLLPARPAPVACDDAAALRLWWTTARLVGCDYRATCRPDATFLGGMKPGLLYRFTVAHSTGSVDRFRSMPAVEQALTEPVLREMYLGYGRPTAQPDDPVVTGRRWAHRLRDCPAKRKWVTCPMTARRRRFDPRTDRRVADRGRRCGYRRRVAVDVTRRRGSCIDGVNIGARGVNIALLALPSGDFSAHGRDMECNWTLRGRAR